MAIAQPQAPIDAAFEQIEGLILPCLTLTLDSLLGYQEGAIDDPRAFAAAMRTMAGELEQVTRMIERNPAAGLCAAIDPAGSQSWRGGALRLG